MYQIMLVEDEALVRESMAQNTNWEKFGFAPPHVFENGRQAADHLETVLPDVVITDICMPFLDGLKLAKLVYERFPETIVVVLTGFSEFSYAQKAIRYHVHDYLLKPVSSAQLLETLGQVAEQIEQEQQQLRSEGANSRSEHEEDVLREHFLNDLLSGSVPTAEAAVQGERWGLLLTAKQYLVCIVRLPENAVQEQVRALTERLCGEESEVCAFFRGSRRLVLLLRGEIEEAVRETAYEFCQNLRHELCQVLGWNALCAIGAPVSRVSALPESYRTAKDTLLQASACAEDGVFGSTDFAGVQHEFDFSAGGSLADKLRHAAPEDVPRIVEGYFGDSAAQDVQSVLYRYYLLMNLLVTASQLADEVQAGSIPPPEDPQAVLGQAATLEGTKACAAEVLGRMTRLCYRHQNVRYSAEISRAKEFIRENYADSGISLHMVAAEVGFSPNHFSTVFSQETGQTFVEYLTAVRIEAAKHLLTNGNSRMSDIAFDVGYQDSHYFSYLFKKHVGVSPREYRSRSEEG
mgnify:FL=1